MPSSQRSDNSGGRVYSQEDSLIKQTAEALGVHPNTVIRDWSLAKVWLKRELNPKGANAG
jgi:hypothetical protein